MPNTYEIKIIGILDAHWSAWFDNTRITTDTSGMSVLTCEVVDQAALFSLLRKIRDAGLELHSVRRIDEADDTTPPTDDN